MFTTKLIIEEIGDDKWKILSPLIFSHGDDVIHVPEGFITDLTTWFPEGRHTKASVMHDFLIYIGRDRRYCNKMMRLAMKDSDVTAINYLFISIGIELKRLWNKVF